MGRRSRLFGKIQAEERWRWERGIKGLIQMGWIIGDYILDLFKFLLWHNHQCQSQWLSLRNHSKMTWSVVATVHNVNVYFSFMAWMWPNPLWNCYFLTCYTQWDKLTRIGLRKSKLDRKWLCALFSQSLVDLQMISWVKRDTLRSAMWTNSSSGVVLQRSLRWKPKPLVSTWAGKNKSTVEVQKDSRSMKQQKITVSSQ